MAECGCRNSLNLVWLQIAMCALGLADQTASTPGKWHPGSYHGVVVGRASADTLVRRLGKPLAVTPEEADEPANDYSYGKSGDFGAEIYAVVSKGIVQEIILSSPSLDLRRLLT